MFRLPISYQSSPFNPGEIPGLLSWVDLSNEGTVFESGGFIDLVLDRYINGYDLSQPSAGNRPQYISGGFWPNNKKSVAQFDGANDFIQNDSFALSGYPVTIAGVYSCSDTGGAEEAFGFGSSTANNQYNYLGKAGDNPAVRVQSGGGQQSALSTYIFNVNEPFFALAEIPDDTERRVFANGGNQGTDTGTESFPNSVNRLRMGARPSSGVPNDFNGNIGEVFIYNRLLTTQEKDDLLSYCQGKWDISI